MLFNGKSVFKFYQFCENHLYIVCLFKLESNQVLCIIISFLNISSVLLWYNREAIQNHFSVVGFLKSHYEMQAHLALSLKIAVLLCFDLIYTFSCGSSFQSS